MLSGCKSYHWYNSHPSTELWPHNVVPGRRSTSCSAQRRNTPTAGESRPRGLHVPRHARGWLRGTGSGRGSALSPPGAWQGQPPSSLSRDTSTGFLQGRASSIALSLQRKSWKWPLSFPNTRRGGDINLQRLADKRGGRARSCAFLLGKPTPPPKPEPDGQRCPSTCGMALA